MAAGIAVGGLSSCGLASKTYKDSGTLSGKITAVRLDNGSGGVTIKGVPSDSALSLHRKVQYRGHKPDGASYRMENGVLVLGGCGNRCSVTYTVDVPTGVPVSGKVSNGAVHLRHVGPVDVTTTNGAVELNGVTGSVQVRTTNGRITGKDLRSDRITTRTTNGRIDLTADTPADVQANTTNGAVTLTLPQARYRMTTESNNGSRHVSIPNTPSAQHKVGVRTTNGGITVRNS